jgi:uncharacterized membrane protein HdeD (DUF308 family)
MVARAAQFWWLAVIRGVVSILFGIGALVLPGLTLAVLILFFGAYMLVDGVFAFVSALRFRHERERWLPLLLEGVLGIGVGAVTYLYPAITAVAWLYTIAFWAFVTGVLGLVAAFRMARAAGSAKTEVLLGLSGVASIVLGVFLVFMPAAGLLALVWVIGTYAIVFGVLLAGFGVRLRSAGAAPPASLPTAPPA